MARRAMVVWLIVGAVLMVGVVSGVLRQWPWRIAERGDLDVVVAVLGGWGVGYAVIAVFVVTDAIRLAKRRDLDGLQRAAHAVKTTAVWFFLINFPALVLLTLVIVAEVDYVYALGAPWLLAGATYLVLLPTSAYGLAALELMRREKAIGRGFFTVNVVLHFLLVVDVFSAVVVVEVARHCWG